MNALCRTALFGFFALLLVLPASLNAATAPAAGKSTGLTYDVYAGGFKALHADLELDLDRQAYDITLTANTQGFIGSLFPWRATYKTAGQTTRSGEMMPSQHIARSSWKDEEKITEMNYGPNGKLLKITVQEGEKTTTDRKIEQELAADSVDLLTGTLLLMQRAKNEGECKGSFPVFDGKRRYNITLTGGGMDTIKQTGFSIYSGKALKCTLKVEPVAGFKKKDYKRGWLAVQSHTEERKKPPTIWFARPDPDGPVIPVRMEINSSYGAVVAHLTAQKKK